MSTFNLPEAHDLRRTTAKVKFFLIGRALFKRCCHTRMQKVYRFTQTKSKLLKNFAGWYCEVCETFQENPSGFQ